nr:immunoglobulin light chain junction region [Macaca mulatta]
DDYCTLYMGGGISVF